jgi:hypothetical protein
LSSGIRHFLQCVIFDKNCKGKALFKWYSMRFFARRKWFGVERITGVPLQVEQAILDQGIWLYEVASAVVLVLVFRSRAVRCVVLVSVPIRPCGWSSVETLG